MSAWTKESEVVFFYILFIVLLKPLPRNQYKELFILIIFILLMSLPSNQHKELFILILFILLLKLLPLNQH